MNQYSKDELKQEVDEIVKIAKSLGIPINAVAINTEKVLSKKEWDSIRLEHLKEYILNTIQNNDIIDPVLISEYNQLIFK